MPDPFRVLIVDDEPNARTSVRLLLNKHVGFTIAGEAANGREALAFITREHPDLVFLDVQMPLMDGFELLAALVPARRPVLIFTTAYDEYALRAFEESAVDYLLKPFSDARFETALVRAQRRLANGGLAGAERAITDLLAVLQRQPASTTAATTGPAPGRRLVFKADGDLHFVEPQGIRWIEGKGDFIKIHTTRRSLLVRATMAGVLAQLDPRRFVRIHRSSIVNTGCVRRVMAVSEYSQAVELDDGKVLQIGKRFRHSISRLG